MAGVPVIGSRIGAIPEAVMHRRNGLLFEPGNVEQLTGHLQRLVDDPDLRHSLATNIDRPKTLQQECDELLQIYESLAA
jgi:glycosyltransferase involved in cell wall biosynthesis